MVYDSKKRSDYRKALWRSRRDEWFSTRPCAVCGSTSDLQLDHVDPSQKESHKIWLWSESRRLNELSKCQSLCVTCHKEKTKLQLSKTFQHGITTAGYVKGCRCKSCTKAHSDSKRLWRAKRRSQGLPYT